MSRISPPPVPTTISTMPAVRVAVAVRVLRREPLVVVVVAVQDEVGAGVVQDVPERRDRRVVAVLAAAEPRLVPHRERAPGVAAAQVLAEPLELR